MSDYSQVPLNEGLLCKQVVYCLSRQKTLSLGKANQMQGILCHLFFFPRATLLCVRLRDRERGRTSDLRKLIILTFISVALAASAGHGTR